MCERCAELEERVAWLESELGIRDDAELGEHLRQRMGLTPAEGHMLMRLYLAHGKIVTTAQLEDAIPPFDPTAPRDSNVVRVYVSRLRRKLGIGRGAIKSAWGRGYSLSAEAACIVGSVLDRMQVVAA
jgi:DNA-binding response OmpR family regulator